MCEFIHIFHSSVWLYLYSEVNLAHLHQTVFQQVHELRLADIVGADGKEHIAVAPMGGIAIRVDLAFGRNLGYGDIEAVEVFLFPFYPVNAADIIVHQLCATGGAQAEFGGNLAVSSVFDVYDISSDNPHLAHMIAAEGGEIQGGKAGGFLGRAYISVCNHWVRHAYSWRYSLGSRKAEGGSAESDGEGQSSFFHDHASLIVFGINDIIRPLFQFCHRQNWNSGLSTMEILTRHLLVDCHPHLWKLGTPCTRYKARTL